MAVAEERVTPGIAVSGRPLLRRAARQPAIPDGGDLRVALAARRYRAPGSCRTRAVPNLTVSPRGS